ncbi:MAG: tRNA (N6-isopentenyl adenosine(37)-C2)-methylthiotransferase MiaB [Firmicutes bacterium CAG:176_63_11]|nr:MAG: tRNA (N6-isopentenyl adenosine(37)-C2)-methylthiotransferase MiaB [Firmicutes bacterium CAG:176_63_11]
MDRKEVLIPQEQLERQREFEQKIRALHEGRAVPPLAMVDTFGCQQNVADSQHIMGMLEAMGFGFTDDPARAAVVVLNTCAIRDHAEKRVYGTLGALTHTKKADPEQVICLCGCMAQRPEVAEKVRQSYRHVDLVFGPQALWKFPELLYNVYTQRRRVFSVADEHGAIAEGMPVVREGRTRAWVSIMYGCNNFCSYCIVPYVRGRERSRDPEQIIAEVRQLVADGFKEITLLGQNVNSYGKDLDTPYDFADLLAALDAIDGDYLIRFMSSQPKDATHKLFDAMARSRHVAKQLHLPVQSGCDRVLRAMNRPYDKAKYLDLITYARKVMPELVLTSDVIIGFPGETEAEAMETVALVEQVRFDALFTFIFSPRPGTPAAKMDDPVSREEKQKWFDRLCDTQNRISEELHAAYVGRSLRCLVDGEGDDARWPLTARTAGGRLVHLVGDKSAVGTYHDVKITDSNTWALFGELV